MVRHNLLGTFEEDVVNKLKYNMKLQNYDLREGVTISKVVKNEHETFDVTLTNGDIIYSVSHVVECIGRKPNISNLGIENMDIKINE